MAIRKIKVLIAFGTRPEAIKMAPVIKQFELNKDKFETVICITAQHREMLDQVLNLFEIRPTYDLNLMINDQKLSELTSKILLGITSIINKEKPDIVFVQGDTSTTFVSALASFYLKIPIAHIEAGLRTSDKYSPFPEEINRRITDMLTNLHFAPTEEAKNNLIKEGISKSSIFVTGNTVVDAINLIAKRLKEPKTEKKLNSFFSSQYNLSFSNRLKTILVTGHRRESFGEGLKNICNAIHALSTNNHKIQIIYPVHLNPNVQKPVYSILGGEKNIHLIPPVDYLQFIYLMKKSYVILTDSGGIQEEAPSFSKPVLVMRDKTERTEGVKAGTSRLVGTNYKKIIKETERLLHDEKEYNKMAGTINPYGKGDASKLIINCVKEYFFK